MLILGHNHAAYPTYADDCSPTTTLRPALRDGPPMIAAKIAMAEKGLLDEEEDEDVEDDETEEDDEYEEEEEEERRPQQQKRKR